MPTTLRPPVGLKTLRRLARRRSARLEAGCFVVEGTSSVAAALAARHELLQVFAEPDADAAVVAAAHAAGTVVTEVEAGRLDGIVSTKTPQPIAAVAVTPAVKLDDVEPGTGTILLVLVDVGDPGNVGTLLRVAEATGVAAVLCAGDTADPFGPKAVRASAGSVFSVGVGIDREAVQSVTNLSEAGWTVLATSPLADTAYDEVDLSGPVAVVLGSEAHGLSDEIMKVVDDTMHIPMVGRAESLNVAMAGSVVCFESLRQRRRHTPE